MKITYTGQLTVTPGQQKKLDSRFDKIGKLLHRGGAKGAHVILTTERHLQQVEITVAYYDHPMAVTHSSTDVFQSMNGALDKLEKQILRQREKWRDVKRRPAAGTKGVIEAPAPVEVKTAKTAKQPPAAEVPRIFKVNHHSRRKPMTMEEALMDLDRLDYTVYRDATTDRIHVLVKRRDGHVDLIEG
ncbi:MAG: ribosome-associated translation inhibitor RaiA [Candidatus Solibacter usitatus]|nr:ribosome-associated translation inhibitor RaiA [Candidatus Solibacter usitatus]